MTLQQNGTVSTSDYSLVNDGSSPPPAAAVDVNALQNPDLTSAPGGLPTCFTEDSYGTNSTSWAYNPTGGYGGGEETLTVTGYGSGTADLIPTLDDGNCAPTVVPGNTYTATVFYESNAPVYITLYTRNATTNAWSYAGQTATFSASPTWTEADDQFQIPSGVNGVSFGMTLQENGTVSTSGYSFVNDGLYSAPTVTVSGPTDATSGAVQYSVTVSGSGVAPTGSVVVSDGQSGSCTISSLTNGTGSCSIDETAAGSPYSVTASYSGDIYYPPATGSTTEDVT